MGRVRSAICVGNLDLIVGADQYGIVITSGLGVDCTAHLEEDSLDPLDDCSSSASDWSHYWGTLGMLSWSSR
eukprot:4477946-Pyramimonas_sp.AAC.1